MKHIHWHPSNFNPDPTEEVTDSIPQGLLDEFDIPPTPLLTSSWQLRLPSSKKADPAMLTVALRHGMTLDHTDQS
jgi:hypothetical protein